MVLIVLCFECFIDESKTEDEIRKLTEKLREYRNMPGKSVTLCQRATKTHFSMFNNFKKTIQHVLM